MATLTTWLIPALTHISPQMPVEIQHAISPSVWQEIINLNHDVNQAVTQSCCIEIIACFFFSPLVFCCHPCINDCIKSQRVQDGCSRINQLYYQGAHVVIPVNNGSAIQLNLFAIHQLPSQMLMVQPMSQSYVPGIYFCQLLIRVHKIHDT